METASNSQTTKSKMDIEGSKYATGRRKTSNAKIWKKKGKGHISINRKY